MITLLTDFGTSDYFVAALKGAILSVNPDARMIDITHEIPAHDIAAAAFTLKSCYRDFPTGTVHLSVVDPGVGSARRPIVAMIDGHIFVGPDNGLFGLVMSGSRELHVRHATSREYFRENVSSTFHGRDIFAPLAAHLDSGLDLPKVGPEISDYKKLALPQPLVTDVAGTIVGEVIHIDRFGNCITNLTLNEIDPKHLTGSASLTIGSERISRFSDHFAQAGEGELFAYPGSAGFWEIGTWCSSAASMLGIDRGARVILEMRGSARPSQ